MAEYLVLARKYRSSTFQEVVGQGHIATTLVNAVRTGRIAQAYLFTGTRGVGKTTMARILAKALNCQASDGPTAEPCNTCDACAAIGRGDDMDVIEIDGASNRGIDEIRELRSNASLRPARCRYKVYYIDEVHMLTKEAFNALLKTLEEPPPHVKFIFATTEAEKIPATILSRCQRFDFRNIATADIAAHLKAICAAEGIGISDDAIFRVAKAAAGSMRDGVSLLDQLISSSQGALTESDVLAVLGTPPDEQIAALVGAIAESDPAAALEALDAILAAGFPLEGVAAAMADQFRNVMLALTCGADSRLIELNDSARGSLKAVVSRFTVPSSVYAVSVCEKLMGSLRGSSSGRALVEASIVRLAASDQFVDPISLTRRLEQLAGGSPAPARKKKALNLPDRPAPAAAPAPPADHPLGTVRWETAWLAERWEDLMNRLARGGFGAAVGLLRAARPLEASAGRIRLGYGDDQEPIRRRAAGPEIDNITRALAALAGGQVQCEFATTESARPAPPRVVTSAQRKTVMDDPAVRTVMEMFGGVVENIIVKPMTGDGPSDDREDSEP
ncbi:MAG: DNA polymerase III subunit gamma/tau [Planctomycetes bacterium]|nr:DNA polymerase III subunit gamma/tau [Planctomycetota bacterium]